MKLHIHAENFRSYSVIDWDLPQGLTLIDGLNKDTGGSNMAGKTTLLDAWFWCRYGWLPKWKGPKGGQADSVLRRKNNVVVGGTTVKVTEQFGPDLIEIERHRPNRLYVWKNGVEQKGMDQKGLEILLGMTADRFLISVYFSQRRQRSFLWMSDNDRMDLMSIVSGLEDLDKALVHTKEQRDSAEKTIDQHKAAIELYKKQLQDLPKQLEEYKNKLDESEKLHAAAKLKAHKLEMRLDEFSYDAEQKATLEIQEAIDPMIDQIAEIQLAVQVLQNTYSSKKQQLAELPAIDPKYAAKVREYESKIEEAKEIIRNRQQYVNECNYALSLATSMEEGTCPQCDQILPEKTRQLESSKYHKEAERLTKLIENIKPLDAQNLLNELKQAQADFHKKTAEIDAAPANIRLMLSEIQSKIVQKNSEERIVQKDIQEIKNSKNREWKEKQAVMKHEVEFAYSEMAHLKKAFETAREAHSLATEKSETLTEEMHMTEYDLYEANEALKEHLDLIEVFGPKGYRAICFDGLIEKISDRAGQLLGVMTEGLYSSRLDQVGQDSKGNQKLILKPVIIKGGSEVPLDDLSGAAEERVALAYDIAVAESAGEGLPLLLDEVLGALDAVGKSEAMALLEEVSKTRPVLVIDHASEFKAMFSQVVRVIYEGEESCLEVA